ncbi:MAG TPA: hypothetical protein VEX62_02780 [Candidatus Limnocylindrales bacterium]|nr:hypothetical protein [Candidatus Limnocylindrales bacterium]
MLEARPPAKVNLTLDVLGRRNDGYHELRSTFLRVGLSDRLTMDLGAGPGDRLTVTGLAGAPTEGNLVLTALDALRRHVAAELPPIDVTLDKRIPAAAGLGGGSSDAASALKLACECWGIALAPAEELTLAASLGSDVPFFAHDVPVATINGRGEHVSPIAAPDDDIGGLLLVTPPISLSTAAVFERFDDLPMRLDEDRLRDANDLWPAAASLEPSLPRLREELERATSVPWLMSGSGPTLFAIYPSVEEASAAGRSLVESRLPELESAILNAVDLIGPDPNWRHP